MKIKIKKVNSICTAQIGSLVETDNETAKKMVSGDIAVEYTDEVMATEKASAIKKEVTKVMATELEVKDQKIEVKDNIAPIATVGEWMQAVSKKDVAKLEMAQKASGMSEGVNADGGYLLTPQITSQIFGATIPGSIIYPKCQKLPLQSSSIKLPIWNNTGVSSTSAPRGFPVTPDGTQKTSTKPVLTQKTVSLVTWSFLVYATEELLEDAPAFGTWITNKCREKAGWDFDYLALYGVAATNGFEGILTAAANAYRAAATVAATITKTSVVNLMKGVLPQYNAAAEWYMSPNTWASAMDVLSTATLVTPSYGLVMSVDGSTLMGKKINIMNQMANLNSNGDILYGDFGQYLVAEKSGMHLAISRDFKFDTDEVAYRITVRQGAAAVIPSQTNIDTSVQAAFAARF